MVSQYPAQIDNNTSLPATIDLVSPITGNITNRLRDAIIQTQTALGINPGGIYGTVRNRLDILESNLSFSTGADLSGSNKLQTVIGLQSRPISNTAPSFGQSYVWDGSEWSPGSPSLSGNAGGDLSNLYPNPKVIAIQSIPISATLPSTGQVLEYNGTNWSPANASSG